MMFYKYGTDGYTINLGIGLGVNDVLQVRHWWVMISLQSLTQITTWKQT